jgi:hypothetical protein
MPCEHLKQGICQITKYNIDNAGVEMKEYCNNSFTLCNLRNATVKLKENEYTYGFVENNIPINGKTFVNNRGFRFKCEDDFVLCPNCLNELQIISFNFGIRCPNCQRQVH